MFRNSNNREKHKIESESLLILFIVHIHHSTSCLALDHASFWKVCVFVEADSDASLVFLSLVPRLSSDEENLDGVRDKTG